MDKAGFLSFYKGIHRPSAKLMSLAPEDSLSWRPAEANMMNLGQLLRHLPTVPATWPRRRATPFRPPRNSSASTRPGC